MLGLKKSAGQFVIPGNIIARQRGTHWHAGDNVGIGRDHTIFAKVAGHVAFVVKGAKNRKFITVIADAEQA
jgi:large subunit ribosomal protein L27